MENIKLLYFKIISKYLTMAKAVKMLMILMLIFGSVVSADLVIILVIPIETSIHLHIYIHTWSFVQLVEALRVCLRSTWGLLQFNLASHNSTYTYM